VRMGGGVMQLRMCPMEGFGISGFVHPGSAITALIINTES
jgi:hypothetical protein